jgi:signal transduction histidine kinase
MTELAPRILVVEDENIVAMDLRASLIRLGYEVTEAVRTGQQAIESAERHRPDTVLMDIRLSGDLDGIEAAEQITKRLDVPVVYLTAFSDEATLRRARVTGPFGYLLKPFDERELHIVIELALFRHRAQKEHEKLLREQAARAAIEKEHRWTQLLAEAGEQLSASLDVDATLQAVARLAVPRLADWAAVHRKEGGDVRTVTVHHAQGKEALLWELLRRYPPDPDLPHAYPFVVRTGKPELLPDMGDQFLASISEDPEHLQLLRALQLRAQMCVPLAVRGTVWGALTLAVSESGRSYELEDLEHAIELARRCAAALDNANLYQAAQDAIAVRDDFLSVASHELRTPLTAIVLGLQSIGRALRRLGDEGLLQRIARVHDQVGRLTGLVDALLDVSRIRAGKLDLKLEEFDLARLVHEVADRFAEPAELARCTLQVRTPAEIRGVWDSMRIDQVLTNLLSNALKFGAGQPVEVTAEGDDGSVRVVVRDQGIGIDREMLPRIFARFERGVSARNYGGLGLGLYITRQLVEAHGGRIEVDTNTEHGAAFIVQLPRRTGAS